MIAEPADIRDVWRDDLVSFAIGCSFSFEEALIEDGIEVRHYRLRLQRSDVSDEHSVRASGRVPRAAGGVDAAAEASDAIRAVQITSRFPSVHGAPVHLGFPASIGISDIAKPDYGDAVPIEADEMPVFWACGVTPSSGDRAGAAGVLHHPRAGKHVDHRPAQYRRWRRCRPAIPMNSIAFILRKASHPAETCA